MCVLLIKVPIRKKSENLFNDPRINIFVICKREAHYHYKLTTQDF